MNEFIVWDEESKRFLSYNDVNLMGGNVTEVAVLSYINSMDECYCGDTQQLTFHNYIGKTDIEGNKIHADCSIVEVKLKDYDSLKFNPNKFIGYFSYNEKTLRYLFHADDKIHGWGADFLNHLEYIKIIGTLQENPELLKEINQC